MESRQEERLRRRLEAILRDVRSSLPEEPWPKGFPPEVEGLLWDYALGLLEPHEEEQVIAVLARSGRAEEELGNIREAMVKAGMVGPIEAWEAEEESVRTLLRAAWRKVREMVVALGGK